MNRLLLAVVVVAFANAAQAEDQSTTQYQNLLTPLLSTSTDIIGNPIAYPDAPAEVTAAEVTIPPGGTTGWHHHEVPLFAHILEGELTVDYGTKGTRVYRAGDSVMEAMDWPHNGTNTGDVPMRLIAVYMGGGGKANAIAETAQ